MVEIPCGFESHHRHQDCSEVSCFGAIFYCPIAPTQMVLGYADMIAFAEETLLL